ncbi:MAG: hypothetical protein VXW22_06875 [Pseudomonadota bacterium]|nr:hypothetical protein [Pseudomonadota bacterium]
MTRLQTLSIERDLRKRAMAIPAHQRDWFEEGRYIFANGGEQHVVGPIFDHAWRKFTVAASPAAVLTLLDERDQLLERIADLQTQLAARSYHSLETSTVRISQSRDAFYAQTRVSHQDGLNGELNPASQAGDVSSR